MDVDYIAVSFVAPVIITLAGELMWCNPEDVARSMSRTVVQVATAIVKATHTNLTVRYAKNQPVAVMMPTQIRADIPDVLKSYYSKDVCCWKCGRVTKLKTRLDDQYMYCQQHGWV